MRFRTLRLLRLLIRESASSAALERQSEPSAVMDSSESVTSFHAAAGALTPVYHFNALACSRLLPVKATLLDLGSGSGQFLAYLARCRPDLKIIGLDLSEKMVEVGKGLLKDAGLDRTVDLRSGDMTDFSQTVNEPITLITSVFAFHHLPTSADLDRCLKEIARVRAQSGCGIWVFDHSRPNHSRTADEFPEIFTPDATSRFRLDSRNSLIASFRFSELSQHLDQVFAEKFEHRHSRLLSLYQAHWLSPRREEILEGNEWREPELSVKHRKEFGQLHGLFEALP